MAVKPSCHLCDEDATLVCTHCHEYFCRDHMIGYICEACHDELAE